MENDMKKERIFAPVSHEELERRFKAVRAAMEKKNLDCLVMQNNNQYLGGYVRWFTGITAENSYPVVVIFSLTEGMTMISCGGPPMSITPPEWSVHGVKERISLPFIPSLNFSNDVAPKATVESLKKYKARSVGLVSKGLMSAYFHEYVTQQMPDVLWNDATDMVDEIKAVKSEEEIGLARRCAHMQDMVYQAIPAITRPGATEYELRSEIQRMVTNLGSEEQLIMIGSAPGGKPSGMYPTFFQNRTLKQGDCICIMIETNGPGGFWCELARTICLGEPPKAQIEAWEASVKVQKYNVELLKPGANPADLYETVNEYQEKLGFPREERLHSHGQGYDVVERPGIRPEETMVIRSNMVISIHPTILSENAYAYCNDDFLVTENGAERIHEMPQELLIV